MSLLSQNLSHNARARSYASRSISQQPGGGYRLRLPLPLSHQSPYSYFDIGENLTYVKQEASNHNRRVSDPFRSRGRARPSCREPDNVAANELLRSIPGLDPHKRLGPWVAQTTLRVMRASAEIEWCDRTHTLAEGGTWAIHKRWELTVLARSEAYEKGEAMRRRVFVVLATLVVTVLPAVSARGQATGRMTSADRAGLRVAVQQVAATETCDGIACVGFIPAGGVGIESADGCNGRVCIHVRGSGLKVDKWWTTAQLFYSDGRMCNPTAYFKAKGPNQAYYHIVDTATVYQCRHEDGLWYAYFEAGGSSMWQDGTRLGNAWDPNPPLSGFPTELVHA
jgi:hypothetical protein